MTTPCFQLHTQSLIEVHIPGFLKTLMGFLFPHHTHIRARSSSPDLGSPGFPLAMGGGPRRLGGPKSRRENTVIRMVQRTDHHVLTWSLTLIFFKPIKSDISTQQCRNLSPRPSARPSAELSETEQTVEIPSQLHPQHAQ